MEVKHRRSGVIDRIARIDIRRYVWIYLSHTPRNHWGPYPRFEWRLNEFTEAWRPATGKDWPT